MDAIFSIDPQEDFQKALDEVLSSYYTPNTKNQTPKDSTDIKSAKEDLKKLLQDTNFDTKKVPETLVLKGWDEQKIAYFVKLLNEKKSELLYASLNNHNSAYGETITNFDWILKLVLGTSDLNTLKHPLLQLILSTESHGTHKRILYDINKDILAKLIVTLETLDEITE